VANLPPVSTSPRQILPLVTLVWMTPVVHLELQISPRIFDKIRKGSRVNPAANFATSSACVVDTGGKFVDGGKLPPVSTAPTANNGNNIRLQTP
jgi:hypothetical protein